ncbi:MAG: MltA domain-containing protein [Deltaproteobacteria bacterium]|nr:MltA domain-containing protein [Deltaproteobacteria bacterium]
MKSILGNQQSIKTLIIVLSFFFLPACAQRLVVGHSNYPELKLTKSIDFHDNFDKEGLRQACLRQLDVLDKLLAVNSLTTEKRAYYEEMADTTRTMLSGIDSPDFGRFVQENFDFYRGGEAGSVLFTGYYTPLLHGSREKDERYQYPVYGVPEDLIFVDLENFNKSGKVKGVVRGRELVPYYRREEIENKLGFEQTPLLYVDDKVALFFLHIQGSGIVEMQDWSTDSKREDGNIKTMPFSALVFDQDSGGAIKGPGRGDIYFAEGDEAAFRAGFMKNKGNIYYLKKKKVDSFVETKN